MSDVPLVPEIPSKTRRPEAVALDRARQALRLASATMPHLSGLARLIRLKPTRRVAVAAVGPSGLILIQPDLFASMPIGDSAFILTHELMHLALDTHGRQGGADPLLVNYAHDYIINDMLGEELMRDPPLGGLEMEGAREKSLETLIVELSKNSDGNLRCWDPRATRRRKGRGPRSQMSRALEDAGLIEREPEPEVPDPKLSSGDLLPPEFEDQFEPEVSPEMRRRLTEQTRRAAAKAASLSELRDKMAKGSGELEFTEPQRGEQMMKALRSAYAATWELALQRWMDAVAPGERTYARPSRRGANRTDVVLPGRRREGWTLHIVLDTSGSMADIIPQALGAIAEFCDSSGVAEVHLVQCDIEVTSDVWVEPPQLSEFRVAGFGLSDMSPGLRHLAVDPEVEAVLVLTDGYIDIPAESPPYRVLWALIGDISNEFAPPYGVVVKLHRITES